MICKTQEQIEPKYQGWWFPPEIVELLAMGEISPSEMVLLGTINQYVSKDKGCFASNAHLALRTGLNKTWISELITKLIEKGLVIEVAYNGRQRALETVWSRIDPDSVKSEWLRDRLRESRGEELAARTSGKPKSDEPGLRESRSRIRSKQEREDKEETSISLSELRSSDGISAASLSDSSGGERKTHALSKFDLLAAQKLYEAIISHRKVRKWDRRKHRKWADSIRLMQSEDEITRNEIKAAIKWYADNVGASYVPEAFSGESFRKKFDKLEEAMRRSQNNDGRNGNGQPNVYEKMIEDLRTGKVKI